MAFPHPVSPDADREETLYAVRGVQCLYSGRYNPPLPPRQGILANIISRENYERKLWRTKGTKVKIIKVAEE